MPRQGKFSTIVGVATIVGAVFAGIAVKSDLLFAWNTAVETVRDQSRVALKSSQTQMSRLAEKVAGEGVAPPTRNARTIREDGSLAPNKGPSSKLGRWSTQTTDSRDRTTRPVARTSKPRRRTRWSKHKPRTKTVSIFAAGKDIPMPGRY